MSQTETVTNLIIYITIFTFKMKYSTFECSYIFVFEIEPKDCQQQHMISGVSLELKKHAKNGKILKVFS